MRLSVKSEERKIQSRVTCIKDRNTSGYSSGPNSNSVCISVVILNALDSTKELEVMESIVNADADLGQRIQEQMFVFDDLLRIDDRGMQTLLRDVPGDRLVIALKGADPTIREKIFSNMSKRAADMMREDLEVKGPVRLSEVDAAQKEILAAARTLAEQGQINLGAGSDEYV